MARGRPRAKWPLSPHENASPVGGLSGGGSEAEEAEAKEEEEEEEEQAKEEEEEEQAKEEEEEEEEQAAAATSRGVLPRASGTESEAPPRSRAAAAGAWPKWRARWRAVLTNFFWSSFVFVKIEKRINLSTLFRPLFDHEKAKMKRSEKRTHQPLSESCRSTVAPAASRASMAWTSPRHACGE